MFAAIRAAELGAEVCLLEKNQTLGAKLLISGGGRCNFTNAEADPRQLAAHYGSAQQALLSPFNKFSSNDCLAWFSQRGMAYKIEDKLRAFPESNNSSSVLSVLVAELKKQRVQVHCGMQVLGLQTKEDRIVAVKTKEAVIEADHFILATGGISHPETGSTGDGFSWLTALGHRVRYPEPSLVPIAVKEKWISDLQGIAIGNGRIVATLGSEELLAKSGKFLFTHFGLSGPLVLNMASDLARLRQKTSRQGELVLKLDFMPDLDTKGVDDLLLEHFAIQHGKKLKNALSTMLAARLVSRILVQSGVDTEKSVSQINRQERMALVQALKGLSLTFKSLMDHSRAVVSSGGLNLDELDFRSMTSKKVLNLSVSGDLLDINRPSGGFSLQLCWSSAWVAASIAQA